MRLKLRGRPNQVEEHGLEGRVGKREIKER
jgi:hypothetical protein